MTIGFRITPTPLGDDGTVIAVRGEVDLFTAPDLKAAIGAAVSEGRVRVVVDLTDHADRHLPELARRLLDDARQRVQEIDARHTGLRRSNTVFPQAEADPGLPCVPTPVDVPPAARPVRS